jgi:hypothetical protein
MTKSYIIIIGNLLSLPLIVVGCLINNFYLAISCFALKIFLSGSYTPPATTMLLNSAKSSDAGLLISSYTFYSYIAQSMAPIFFNFFAN